MCQLVTEAGADFIKTSTGFSTGGATREELQTAIEQSGSYHTMGDSCRELVLHGVTTVEEARKTITALE